MDKRIRERLEETSDRLLLYNIAIPSQINDAFNFDVRNLETVDSAVLSKFVVMLSQYLVTLRVKFNTARIMASESKKILERRVMSAAKNSEAKTLKEREREVLENSPELLEMEIIHEADVAERDLLEGLDGPITELINAFKSEIKRRAEEKTITNSRKY